MINKKLIPCIMILFSAITLQAMQEVAVTEIYALGQGEISLLPGEQIRKLIFTANLYSCLKHSRHETCTCMQPTGLCTALAMIITCKSGAHHVMMSRYPATQRMAQVNGLKFMMANYNETSVDPAIGKKLILLVPRIYEQIDNMQWRIKIEEGEELHTTLLGKIADVKPTVIEYYDRRNITGISLMPQKYVITLTQDGATWQSWHGLYPYSAKASYGDLKQ